MFTTVAIHAARSSRLGNDCACVCNRLVQTAEIRTMKYRSPVRNVKSVKVYLIVYRNRDTMILHEPIHRMLNDVHYFDAQFIGYLH